jgi:hypothetical protein
MSSQGCQLYVLKVSYGSIQPFLSSSNLSRYLLNDLRIYICNKNKCENKCLGYLQRRSESRVPKLH